MAVTSFAVGRKQKSTPATEVIGVQVVSLPYFLDRSVFLPVFVGM